MKISLSEATSRLRGAARTAGSPDKPFVELLAAPGFSLELYRPVTVDLQTPHQLDELYFVAAGTSGFVLNAERFDVTVGDVLFVPAHADHRFVDIGTGFAVWVVFIGSLDEVSAPAHDQPAATDAHARN